MPFESDFQVSWAQLDANAHMANTAYLDIVVDARFRYFAQQGFTPAEFARLRIGPVVKKDEVEYFRELRLLDTFKVNFRLAGINADASRFRLCNEIHRSDGVLSARITTLGGWMDLAARKLVAPSALLAAALNNLERTADFASLD